MKTIFITGANRGIGLELAKQYFFSGFRVIASCRDSQRAEELKQLEKAGEGRVRVIQLDLNDSDQIHALEKVLEKESIDILINNAGVGGKNSAAFGLVRQQEALDIFKTNIIAPLLVTQILIKQIQRSEKKIIVNMSSNLASIAMNDEGDFLIYRASKAALNAITKNLSIDLKNSGVTVIALHPGWVKTEMGGPEAEITTEHSVSLMRRLIDSLSINQTGNFLSYEGEKLLW